MSSLAESPASNSPVSPEPFAVSDDAGEASPDERSPGLFVPPIEGDGAAAQIHRLRQLVNSLLEQNEQLQTALDSRIVIEQAKGILAVQLDRDVDDAFAVLRGAARANRLRLHELAATVVRTREVPAVVQGLLDSS